MKNDGEIHTPQNEQQKPLKNGELGTLLGGLIFRGHVSCGGPVFCSEQLASWASPLVLPDCFGKANKAKKKPSYISYVSSCVYHIMYIYIHIFFYLCGVEPDKTKVYKLHNNLLVNINSDRNRF